MRQQRKECHNDKEDSQIEYRKDTIKTSHIILLYRSFLLIFNVTYEI